VAAAAGDGRGRRSPTCGVTLGDEEAVFLPLARGVFGFGFFVGGRIGDATGPPAHQQTKRRRRDAACPISRGGTYRQSRRQVGPAW
jgi:hypothetical protein